MSMVKGFQCVIGVLTLGLMAPAMAIAGQPVDWQLNFQEAATPVMENINAFHNLMLPIITAIVILVLGLLVWVMVRYNRKANPNPSRTSHNTFVEVVWTVIPILILVVVAIPSLRLLYFQDRIPEADLTVKTIGYQWYWGYEYPGTDISFDALMLEREDAEAADLPALLATDYAMVVPVNKTVKVLVTASDVIHNWAMPAFGIKMDAVPGRLNETWFRAEKEGLYYGQCSELCGVRHAFMPIMVKVVSEDVYEQWAVAAAEDIDEAQALLARLENSPTKLAAKAD